MKTLIIHPDDRSTDFLRSIYLCLRNKTVITKNVTREELHKLIKSHDQIMMMGHGAPGGLFNSSRIGDGLYTIGMEEVPHLRGKKLVAIWCNADRFIEYHKLDALYTGMFVSEIGEALMFDIIVDQKTVNESNNTFARLLGKQLRSTPEDQGAAYKVVLEHYSQLAKTNPVARYNSVRWYYQNKTALELY
jgi:hypothetical protein